jgi:hypothetical protein
MQHLFRDIEKYFAMLENPLTCSPAGGTKGDAR